ncbi:hypothetical protein AVEN_146094-1 [Araneus ventricosus]|uniref:Uncharacterized protein n=1 Tax=Araneus ventricosus TaxID=182803 RepID=A0A4Y2GQH3_ARAVE|nr:hypothetical protein AVEN_146094-1 [Araneus ventricosus]
MKFSVDEHVKCTGDAEETRIANCHQAFQVQKFDRELPKQKSEIVYLTVDFQQITPLPKLSVRYFKVIEHKFPEVGYSYLDSDLDFGRIEKNLRKHEAIFLPEQYRGIIMQSGRNHHVTDMTPHFRNFKHLRNKVQLRNRKRNVLNVKVAFRDSVKWIRVEEFGSYLYKDCCDPYIPFKKVDLRKQIRWGAK